MSQCAGAVRRAMWVTILLAAGCVTGYRPSGFLEDYSKLERGERLGRVWVSEPHAQEKTYRSLYVEPISIRYITDQRNVSAESCGVWLRNAVAEAGRDSTIRFHFSGDPAERDGVLQLAITKMLPGSAGSRILPSDLGAGSAWVRIEGRVVDTVTGEEVFLFEDMRRSSEEPRLEDLPGRDGWQIVQELLHHMGHDVVVELTEQLGS